MAPADAAGHLRRVGQPEIAEIDHTQPVAAEEHAHMLVAPFAAPVDPEPGIKRQSLDDVIALNFVQFLGADDVGIGGAQCVDEMIAAVGPVIQAVAFQREADVERHDAQVALGARLSGGGER
jgi:hypothetical protein